MQASTTAHHRTNNKMHVTSDLLAFSRSYLAVLAIVAIASFAGLVVAENLDGSSSCTRRFSDLYKDGKDLCERLFGDAFVYIPRSEPFEYELAYTMWFFSDSNPNDATTMKRVVTGRHDLGYTDTSQCYLRSPGVTRHKERPSAENASTFTECHPYQKNSCCLESTVENEETLNGLYGDAFRWDQCEGGLSRACKAFFVQESCFYECDPNAGLFRKYPPHRPEQNASVGPEWEIAHLPLKGDYCDAWYAACRQDFAPDCLSTGNIFACGASRENETTSIGPSDAGNTEPQHKQNKNRQSGEGALEHEYSAPGTAVLGITITSAVLVSLLGFTIVLIRKERQGRPLFMRIVDADSRVEPRGSPLQGLDSRRNQVVVGPDPAASNDPYREVYVI